MKGKLACVAVIGLLAAGLLVAQTTRPAKPKVQVDPISLGVNRPLPADKQGLSLFGRGGTSLKLLISLPGMNIIGTDVAACKLTTFTDDKGTDLSKTRSWGFRPGWLGSSKPHISKDAHACIMEVRSDQVPARGASKLTLKVKLGLKCGTAETTYTEKVALKIGSEIKFPLAPMKVRTVTEGGWGGMKMTVSLTSTKPTDAIRKITFLGPDGKEIKHRVQGTGYSGRREKMTYETSYGLAKKVDSVTLKITYYSKVETVAVPVDISVGVGL